jgi:flagellin-like protein
MKGLSPLIASVILIAIAITIAGIFSGWFTDFIKAIASMVQGREGSRVECSYGGIALDDLEYNTTSKYLSGYIENTGIITLGDIELVILYDNATTEEKDLNKVIEPREKDFFDVIVNENYEKVRVLTNCSDVFDEFSEAYIPKV